MEIPLPALPLGVLMLGSMSLDSPSEQQIDGSEMRIAIVAARFNESLVDSLVAHASETL